MVPTVKLVQAAEMVQNSFQTLGDRRQLQESVNHYVEHLDHKNYMINTYSPYLTVL